MNNENRGDLTGDYCAELEALYVRCAHLEESLKSTGRCLSSRHDDSLELVKSMTPILIKYLDSESLASLAFSLNCANHHQEALLFIDAAVEANNDPALLKPCLQLLSALARIDLGRIYAAHSLLKIMAKEQPEASEIIPLILSNLIRLDCLTGDFQSAIHNSSRLEHLLDSESPSNQCHHAIYLAKHAYAYPNLAIGGDPLSNYTTTIDTVKMTECGRLMYVGGWSTVPVDESLSLFISREKQALSVNPSHLNRHPRPDLRNIHGITEQDLLQAGFSFYLSLRDEECVMYRNGEQCCISFFDTSSRFSPSESTIISWEPSQQELLGLSQKALILNHLDDIFDSWAGQVRSN